MVYSMDAVKSKVNLRSDAKSACTLRIVLSILIGPTMLTYGYILLGKLLKAVGLSGVSDVISMLWKSVGSILVVVLLILYIYRTNIRKWSYSYMLDYREKALASGFTVCPRCGSPLTERTQNRSYQQHAGDKVTTTTWSDGTVTTKRDPIYQTVNYQHHYFVCTNPDCKLKSSVDKIKYGKMPATVNGACDLILKY